MKRIGYGEYRNELENGEYEIINFVRKYKDKEPTPENNSGACYDHYDAYGYMIGHYDGWEIR